MRVSALLLPVAVFASEFTPLTQSVTATPSLETLSFSQPAKTGAASIQTANSAYSPSSAGDSSEEELRKRQNAGQVNGAAVAATVATQQSPVTTYMIYGDAGKQTPVVFTQLFSAVLEQWDGPLSGSIGLGSITGEVGVVKTKAKRNLVAAATDAVKHIEKRAKAKSGSASTNDSGGLSMPRMRITVIVSTAAIVLPFLFFRA